MINENFSDYIVYVDESGDHSLEKVNSEYPIFALAFCIFKKLEYLTVVQQIINLKFKYFGHDKVVFHENDIRRRMNDFKGFTKEKQTNFMNDYWKIINNAKFTVISCVIDKNKHKERYISPDNPYELSMRICIERFIYFLKSNNIDQNLINYIIVEKRGKNEDAELELAFRRICDNKKYNLRIRMADKRTNCAGLQIADLIARPIGLNVMRPEQLNRGFNIIKKKLRVDDKGSYTNYGLKILP